MSGYGRPEGEARRVSGKVGSSGVNRKSFSSRPTDAIDPERSKMSAGTTCIRFASTGRPAKQTGGGGGLARWVRGD